jgi:hypothetical protein
MNALLIISNLLFLGGIFIGIISAGIACELSNQAVHWLSKQILA